MKKYIELFTYKETYKKKIEWKRTKIVKTPIVWKTYNCVYKKIYKQIRNITNNAHNLSNEFRDMKNILNILLTKKHIKRK